MQIMIKIVESHQSRAMSQPSKGAVGGHDLSDIICPELVKSLLVIIIVESWKGSHKKPGYFTGRLNVGVPPPPLAVSFS